MALVVEAETPTPVTVLFTPGNVNCSQVWVAEEKLRKCDKKQTILSWPPSSLFHSVPDAYPAGMDGPAGAGPSSHR